MGDLDEAQKRIAEVASTDDLVASHQRQLDAVKNSLSPLDQKLLESSIGLPDFDDHLRRVMRELDSIEREGRAAARDSAEPDFDLSREFKKRVLRGTKFSNEQRADQLKQWEDEGEPLVRLEDGVPVATEDNYGGFVRHLRVPDDPSKLFPERFKGPAIVAKTYAESKPGGAQDVGASPAPKVAPAAQAESLIATLPADRQQQARQVFAAEVARGRAPDEVLRDLKAILGLP